MLCLKIRIERPLKALKYVLQKGSSLSTERVPVVEFAFLWGVSNRYYSLFVVADVMLLVIRGINMLKRKDGVILFFISKSISKYYGIY